MKYWVRVGESGFEMTVGAASEQTVVALDGREYQVELMEGAPGVYRLVIDGSSYDVALVRQSGDYAVAVEGVPFDVAVEDYRTRMLAMAGRPGSRAEGEDSIRAPMPGLVVQVDVREGETVDPGRRLVVLEAMKMENDIASPRAGKVKQIKVSEGQIVEQGQQLVILE